MKKRLFICLVTIQFIFFSSVLRAAIDPTKDWYTIESEHMIVHYANGNKALAEKALTIAERVHKRHTKDLSWVPLEKTHIVLSDETDTPNGYATPIYFNRTVLFLAPPTSINTLEDFDDWFTTLITHEYLHIIHLDKSDGAPEGLRSIFGRFQFLFPNVFQPTWVLEGLATHKETDIDRGIGRGQSTMYQVMMREEVRKGLQPVDHVNLPVVTWPAGSTRYLYGTYFMSYIAEVQSENALHNWVEGYSDNLLPFFVNTNAKQTLGENLEPLWQDYSSWLKDKFIPQVEAIKSRGMKQGEKVSKDAYRTGSVQTLGDAAYYVRSNGYQQAALMKIDSTAKVKELVELNSLANIDAHPVKGLLIAQDEYCNRYHIYKDLYHYDEKNKKLKRLTECGRYIYARWNAEGSEIYAVKHQAGTMSLHHLNAQGEELAELWRGNDGEVLGQIDVSADDKKIVAALWRKKSGWNIELFDIKQSYWQALTRGTAIESAPQYTPDGNIIFSHEANGSYNLYRYELKTQSVKKLSNVMGAALQPSQGTVGSPIYYGGYSAEGFGVFRLDDSSAMLDVDISDASTLMQYDYDINQYQQSDYTAWPSMRPRWWFPVFGYGDQRAPLGISTASSDALAFHNYFVTAAWDFKLDSFEGNIAYRYNDRLFLSYTRKNNVFLDANDELAFSTARDIAGISVAFPYRKLLAQHNILLGLFFDRESKNNDGSVKTGFSDFEDHLLGVAWLYNSSKIFPLAISKNDGLNLRLVAEDSDALNSDFSGQVYTLDWQQFIRTGKESVIALRFMQGWGSDNPNSFELGGEDLGFNALSYIFDGAQESVFNRRDYPLRGYKEGQQQLRGRRAQLLTAEWRFPIQRNERGIMAPPIGLMQWSGNVFVETGTAYQDSPQTYYNSAGVEINIDTNLFYLVPLRLRLGYAHGFDDQIGDDRVYLSAGSIF